MPAVPADPWTQVADLDGREKYRILQVSYYASYDEIKKAYRELARKHHPDKGGDAAHFARIQDAFETLSVKSKRAVYDEWAKEFQFRPKPQRYPQAQGGEDVLFNELATAGVVCDPFTQLVVLCEVCGRPSTKECWTCKMPICSFCTLKRHWREGFALHWPLINSAHMETRLAKRELEKKRIEDAKLLDMENPHWRSESEMKDIRAFKVAALKMQDRDDRLVHYDYALARLYMWAQTDRFIYLAVHIPTGYEDRELTIDCDGRVLRIQVEGSPPVMERAFNQPISTIQPINSFRTKDNRTLVLALPKDEEDRECIKLFRGDSDKVRCMGPPYTSSESERDVSIEAELPSFVEPEDVLVNFSEHSLDVRVAGLLGCCRSFWKPRDQKKLEQFHAIDTVESMWSLEDGRNAKGEACRHLFINLVKPEPSEDETTWKKGKRDDNMNAERSDGRGRRGFRFFQDDEDEFGLEDILQAICFLEVGCTFVPTKPWEQGSLSRTVHDVKHLSQTVQQHLAMMQRKAKETE